MNNHIIKIISIFLGFNLLFQTKLFSQQQAGASADSSLNTTKNSYWNKLIHGNVDRSFEQKLDLSFVVAPSYAHEAGFGIGGMATGLYRLDRTDSTMQPSNIMMSFNASVKGFYAFVVEGNNNFKGNCSRLSYKLAFFNRNMDFWGISYNDCDVNPVINYKRQTAKVYANYQYKLIRNAYAGATIDFMHTRAAKIDNVSYLKGQNLSYITSGLGVFVQYDSRDFIPNPKRGVHLFLRQMIYPETLSDAGKTIWRTTFVANCYQQIWSGGTLAFDLYGQASSGNLPWSLREELGDDNRMRGYYMGSYIDNNITSTQVELRQHIAGRFGFAAWIGAGTVFPSMREFDMAKMLPNCGLGAHFEMKHNVNARIDFGFGKETSGFVLGLSSAF